MRLWLRHLLIPDNDSLPPLAYWRERVLRATLVGGSVGGMVAYAPGVIFALQAGQPSVAVVDTAAYLLIIFMALRPDLPFVARAGSLVVLPLVLAVVLLIQVESVAAGAAWLTAFPIVASLFFGLWAAAAALIIQFLVVAALGIAVALGVVTWGMGLALYPQSPTGTWMITGTNVLLLSTVLSLTGGVLLRALERTAEREVTARRELEAEVESRQALEVRVLQSEKLESMGTLAAGIAHDFNNLLVPILIRSREVMESFPSGHPARNTLQDVVLSATRARDMVRRVLTFSRGLETERRPVALEEAIREVRTLLRNTLPVDVRLDVDMAAQGAHVWADPSELHQILMNLTTNSYHAMRSGGGVLGLSTRFATTEGADTRQVVIEVNDTGVGMPPEILSRIYEPFFTTRANGEGTGLGIPTVHRLVLQLGGSLTFTSEVGNGTSVYVTLPITEATPVDPDPSTGLGADLPDLGDHPDDLVRSPLRVALVDDDPPVLRATQGLLTRMGFQVTAFPFPEAALRHLDEPGNQIDLMLTDYIMPGMTGVELAEAAKGIRPELPILLSSGSLDQPLKERLLAAGISGVLEKPWEPEELMVAVRKALDRA